MANRGRSIYPIIQRPVLRPGNTALFEGGGVSLAAFMASQANGLWFDTTKTDRFFQESVGPTLADDVGEAMGLALDQRTWNGQTLAQVLATQSELFVGSASNDNSTAPSTTTESPAGQFNLTSDGASAARRDLPLTTVVGQAYQVSFTNSGAIISRVGSAVGGTQNLGDTTYSGASSYIFVATATTSYLRWSMVAATTRTVTSISIKAIPGNHGVQATGSLKPLRQTTGAKFDGSDDNWLTTYSPASTGASFMVALLTGPTVVSGNHYAVGSLSGANDRFFMGVNNAGVFRAGVGAMVSEVGPDLRGVEVVCGITADGAGLATQFVDALAYTPFAYTGTLAGGALRVGALNNGGSASSYFGGSVKKLVVGREALTLAKYLQIRSQLLAA